MELIEDFDKFYRALHGDGAFLVVKDRAGRTNIMTIGWATVGIVWSKPVMTVFVRPNRYTYEFMEDTNGFSVCVPSAGKLKEELIFCGTNSGRMVDKVKQCKFTMSSGMMKGSEVIGECKHFYECEIIHKNTVDQNTLAKDIVTGLYPKKDFHIVYYGEIKHCYVRE